MRIIDCPMFTINGLLVNEYTVRALQVDVAKGLVQAPEIIDADGNVRTIKPDGRLTGPLKGFSLSTNLMMQIMDSDTVDESTEYTSSIV